MNFKRNDRDVIFFSSPNDEIMDAFAAADFARQILTLVDEIRALPPDGWTKCTTKPSPGTRVRIWRPTSAQRRDMLGVVAEDPPKYGDDRVVVGWGDGAVGEPIWDELLVEAL